METKGYFTFADKITQERMRGRTIAERRNRVERNLKASLLLNHEVIFRAYSVIESDITEAIFRDNPNLLEKGVLIPEYRNDEVISTQCDHYLLKSKPKRVRSRKLEMAEIIDALPSKTRIDGDRVSHDRSKCLALLLYRLAIAPNDHLKSGVKCSDLDDIFDILFNRGIPDRSSFLKGMKKLFIKQADATNLVQAVYFGVGAHYTESNPIWTNEINPHKRENLRIWLTKQPDLKQLSGENLRTAERFHITDFLEENENDLAYLNKILSYNQRAEKVCSSLRVSSEDLDVLSFDDILHIRSQNQYSNFQDYLKQNISEDDFKVSRKGLVAEEKKYEFRRKTAEVTAGATCTVMGIFPLAGMLFSIIPTTIELFFSKKKKQVLSTNLALFSYSEIVKEKVDSRHESGLSDEHI